MMKTKKKQAGFTLLELMIVVAILSVLAAVAMVAYGKYVDRAHAAEATSILSDIKIKQEAYRATFRQYFGIAGYNPSLATLGDGGRLWPSPNPWAQLGVKPDNDLYYSYTIVAGPPDGTAPAAPFATAGIDVTNDFWYAARALEDLDGDNSCGAFEIYHGKASIVEIDEGNANCNGN